MKLLRIILLVPVCLPLPALSAKQAARGGVTYGRDFLLDPSKPYVYLELDHVGSRKPLREGEPNVGIWLRLKNNCKLPIVIMVLGAPPSASGEVLSVIDEVVPDPQMSGGDGSLSAIITPHGLEEMTDIFHFPNMTEAEVRAAEDLQRRAEQEARSNKPPERPHGYNAGYEPIFPTLTEILPGGQVLFSLPANHVSKTWHFEIPFRLALPNKGRSRPPYSYVAFYQEDLKNDHGTAPPPVHMTH